MKRCASRLSAAFLLLVAGTHLAPAQSRSVEVPQYRQLGASEPMSTPGANGTDYSANAPSLAGLTPVSLALRHLTLPRTCVHSTLGDYVRRRNSARMGRL